MVDLLSASCKGWCADKLEVLIRPSQGCSVQICEAFMLKVISNDCQLCWVVPCQLIEAAQAEQQVLKAVASMLLHRNVSLNAALRCDKTKAERPSMLLCAHQSLRCANVCDGNAQKSSQGFNALVTSVTDTNQLLPHKVTISASNKAAKMCKLWSYDIEFSDSLFVSTVLCRTATD